MTAVTEINKKNLSFICWFIFVIIVIFGLWPFNLNPFNQVFWLKEVPGVRFSGPGHLYSAGSLSDFFSGRREKPLGRGPAGIGIELTQAYLPTRDSSAGDLVFNILGTLIGIGLALNAEPKA